MGIPWVGRKTYVKAFSGRRVSTWVASGRGGATSPGLNELPHDALGISLATRTVRRGVANLEVSGGPGSSSFPGGLSPGIRA